MTSTRYRWHSCSKEDFPFKRHKVPKACQLCRQKKMRCDGVLPCARCTQHSLQCCYEDEGRRQRSEHSKVKDEGSNSDDGGHSNDNTMTTSGIYSYGDDSRLAAAQLKSLDKKSSRNTSFPLSPPVLQQKRSSTSSSGASSSSPPLPSPTSSSSQKPQPQPQQQLQQQHEYIRSSLKRISFANDLYESMRQNDSNVVTKSFLFGTQLPPLLFDFFNLTSQPYKIWSSFITQFTLFLNKNNTKNNNNKNNKNRHATLPDSLAKDVISLFSKFNLLYSAMFNFTPLHNAIAPALSQLFCGSSTSVNNANTSSTIASGLQTPTSNSSSSSSPNNNSDNDNSIEQTTVLAIHAVVFHAAFQSLATSCQNIASSLEHYADLFYREAHRQFWDATLTVDKNRSFDTNSLLRLTRVAILLAHYQCAAVCEEQAYTTLRIGIGYALRCGLSDIISNSSSNNDPSITPAEKKRLKALYRILNAWNVWFSFYLHRNEWESDPPALSHKDDPSLSFNLIKINDAAAADSKGSKQQRWAMQVTDTYTEFLKRLCKTNMKCLEIKQHLEALHSLSKANGYDARKTSTTQQSQQQHQATLPSCILSLYHHTLTIQVFFCQIPASISLFRRNSAALEAQSNNKTTAKLSPRNMILDICDSAAADIVHIIDDLTMDYHTLPGETDQVRHHDPIVHAVLYPLCIAASVSVSCLRQRRPCQGETNDTDDDNSNNITSSSSRCRSRSGSSVSNDISSSSNDRKQQDLGNNKKRSSTHAAEAVEAAAATAAAAVAASTEPKAATLMPIYKLQRLLNPIRSQIEVANVFTESFNEIQATAAKPLPPQTTTATVSLIDNNRFIPAPPTTVINPHLQRPPPPTKPSRFVDHQWLDALGPAWPDESLMNETFPLQAAGGTSGRGPGYPLDRNDIDREQLEKLSHKKDLRSSSNNSTSSSSASIVVNGIQATSAITMTASTNADIFRTTPMFSEAAVTAAAAVAAHTAPGLSLRNTMTNSLDPYSTAGSSGRNKRRNTLAVQHQHQHQQQQTLLAHGQKRQYAAAATTNYPNLDMEYPQQQQQQQQQQMMATNTPKRMRTDSVYSDDAVRQMEMLRADPRHQQQQQQRLSAAAAAAAAQATTNSNFNTQQHMQNSLNMQDIHDQSGLSMYTTDFFLMDLTDPAAAAAVAATTSAASDQSMYQSRIPDRTPLRNEAPPTPEPFSSSVMSTTSTAAAAVVAATSTGSSMVSNITSSAPKVPLLPAPQPNLPSNKSWTQSRQKDWNIDFQPSIIETLHQNTHMSVEPASFGTAGIVDPSSMSINIDPMTSHTTTQQPNLNDNSNVLLFFNTMNNQQQQQQQQQQRLSQQQHQQQHQGDGGNGSSGWYTASSPSRTTHVSAYMSKVHQTQKPPGNYTDGSSNRRPRHQKRTRSPRSSSSLDQQQPPLPSHHNPPPHPPSLSEPTNSSASDGRSTSASPAMFGQEQWINVSQNKVPTDVLTSWH